MLFRFIDDDIYRWPRWRHMKMNMTNPLVLFACKSLHIQYSNWINSKLFFFAQYKLLTPWLVRASISFSISGQCWGHSLFIISTMIRDRTSLMWLSSSRIERVPWEDPNRHQISVYDRFIWIIRPMLTLLTAYCYHTYIWQQLHGTLLQLDFLLLLHVVPSEPARKASFLTNMPLLTFLILDLWSLCSTHLMTCSRICKPKCRTTAGWALSASCKPHGTQKELLSLNSSQNCREK